MAELELDAVLYPLQKILVAEVGAAETERERHALERHRLSGRDFPRGILLPRGAGDAWRPVGGGVSGIGVFGGPSRSQYAYGFEQAFKPRRPPASTPALPSEP